MAIVTITTPNINKTDYTDLVSDLLENIVHGDTAPFKDAVDVFTDYIETSTNLDATQRAGALSSFLKESYSQINQQAMSAALELLKANEAFKLEKYAAEGKYNNDLAQQAIAAEELKLKAIELAIKEKELALADRALLAEAAKSLETLAKLKKQYGYGDAALSSAQVLVTDENGVAPGGDGYITTYGTSITASLGTSTDDGALDKQIAGYDKLNLKDVLKTMDEKAALMQNAKVPETIHEKAARIELIAEISRFGGSSMSYKLLHDSTTYIYTPNNDDTPFNGSWSPSLP